MNRRQVPGIGSVAKRARQKDEAARRAVGKKQLNAVTTDSFQNFLAKLGIGTDNLSTGGTYGFNPISRQRTILEWAHRGDWLCGMAVDIVAADMTRAGVDVLGDMPPEDIERIESTATTLKVWSSIEQVIKWARLYGGCIGVLLIDGQDPSTPLRLDTVGQGQFKGVLPLDRWMVEADLTRRVRTLGPDLGLPEWYNVVATAPAFVGMRIHYTRCLRVLGVELPYWQSMMENLWGISVLERLWDRGLGFNSATAGLVQLVYKSYLRTLKVKDLRDLVATGTDQQLNGLTRYVDMARRFQTVEGFTLIDGEDEFGEHTGAATSFSGINEAMLQIEQQLSGATEIPLVRFLGQSPAGLNSTGESDMRNYYDGIAHKQNTNLIVPVTAVYRCMAQSEGLIVPNNFGVQFRPLWQLTEIEKSEVAAHRTDAVTRAYETGNLSPQTYLKELKQMAKLTGAFSNIMDKDIDAAEEITPPAPQGQESENNEEHDVRIGDITQSRSLMMNDSLRGVGALAWRHGLHAVVETPAGSVRRGDGWEVRMPADYGYLRMTNGADEEQLDCFIGSSPESDAVFIVNQCDIKTGVFDEHKVMLGYTSSESALEDWILSRSSAREAQSVLMNTVSMSMDQFKEWMRTGNMRAPAKEERTQ